MTADQQAASRPAHAAGETSGSPQRPAQRLTGQALAFDLQSEIEALRSEASWQRGDRNAKTLVKEQAFRVVLTALKAGARLDSHEVHAQFTLHGITGRVRVTVPGQTIEVPAGHVLSVEEGTPHGVEAVEESAFLLTIAAPRQVS
jgi:quercetin dioxygenase-like cupin family protein